MNKLLPNAWGEKVEQINLRLTSKAWDLYRQLSGPLKTLLNNFVHQLLLVTLVNLTEEEQQKEIEEQTFLDLQIEEHESKNN